MSRYYTEIRKLMKEALSGDPREITIGKLRRILSRLPETVDAKKKLKGIWTKQVEDEKILDRHAGVTSFDLASIRPQLRDELDRRILSSISLIKLHRDTSVETVIRRFDGWISSLSAVEPIRQKQTADMDTVAKNITKPLKQLPFAERRVAIDQGHKLVANLNQIVAYDEDAIGAIWHSHWREAGYDYREDHKDLDKKFYLIKNSGAMREGLIKKVPEVEYIEELEDQPAELPYCRCYFQYIYRLNKVPEVCLTEKGKSLIRGTS